MYGASSNFNPYPKMGSHGNMSGHAHGGHGHGGHGHSHAPGEECGMHGGAGVEDENFPSPGPQDKPKPPPPPASSKPDPASMNIVQSVQYGEMAKLKEFIENGTNVRTPDAENVTLLHWAAINNRTEIVKYVYMSGYKQTYCLCFTTQHCENLVCTQFIVYIRNTSATLTFGLKTITTDHRVLVN